MDTLIKRDARGGVLTLTMDSPHNRNALSRQLVSELHDGLRAADEDPETVVVVLTHTGTVFCSGADLSEAKASGGYDGPRAMIELQRTIAASPKPVVVRIEGAVRAGGLGVVGAADIVLASSGSTFALTEARLGLAPAVISPSLLSRMAPRAAQFTFLSGQTFTGVEAAAFGLVTQSVDVEDLDSVVADVCSKLLRAHPQGLRETKKLLNAAILRALTQEGEELAVLSERLFGSSEAKEAMASFLASRRRRPASSPTT